MVTKKKKTGIITTRKKYSKSLKRYLKVKYGFWFVYIRV